MRAGLLVVLLAGLAVAGPDLSPTAFIAPRFYVRAGWHIPAIRVANLGSEPAENFLVVCRIDSFNRPVYQCTTRVAGPLLPGRDSAFRFPRRTLYHWWSDYDIRFRTVLAADSVPGNDSARTAVQVTEWMMFEDRVECGPGGATVDGSIGYYEYQQMPPTDISDLLGRGGVVPAEAGSCLLYTCHDYSYTYFGFDFRNVLTRADGDQVRVWMDEDFDGRFGSAADSTEGFHTAFVRGGVDSVTYWLYPGRQCPGCLSASSTRDGNLQLEMRVPFGERPGDYDVEPDWDSAGIGLQAELTGLGSLAWWPQRIPSGRMNDPAHYGCCEWFPVVGVGQRDSTGRGGRVRSTVVRGVVVLSRELSADSRELELLDASGRKVMGLALGLNDVRHLAPGVYFVRSEQSAVGRQRSAVRKVVVAR